MATRIDTLSIPRAGERTAIEVDFTYSADKQPIAALAVEAQTPLGTVRTLLPASLARIESYPGHRGHFACFLGQVACDLGQIAVRDWHFVCFLAAIAGPSPRTVCLLTGSVCFLTRSARFLPQIARRTALIAV